MGEKMMVIAVTVDGRPLQHIVRYSPTGFEWGYGGSGPADLALSILRDYLGDHPEAEEIADRLYQEFKECCIARLPLDGWRLSGADVARFLSRHGVRMPIRGRYYAGRRFILGL